MIVAGDNSLSQQPSFPSFFIDRLAHPSTRPPSIRLFHVSRPSAGPVGCQTVRLFVGPFSQLPARPSVRPSLRPSVRPSIRPSVRQSGYRSIRPAVRHATIPPSRPPALPSGHPSIHPSSVLQPRGLATYITLGRMSRREQQFRAAINGGTLAVIKPSG